MTEMPDLSASDEQTVKIDAKTAEIIDLYMSGLGIRSIGKQVGLSGASVKARLIKANCYKGQAHETKPVNYFSKLSTWKKTGAVNLAAYLDGGGIATFGIEGSLSCPLPQEWTGKRCKVSCQIVPGAFARVALGIRSATTHDAVELFIQPIFEPQTFHVVTKDALQPGSEFYIQSGGLQGCQIRLSEPIIEQLPDLPPPPTLDLREWQAEGGVGVEAKQIGWALHFPTADSQISTSFAWSEHWADFSANIYLLAPSFADIRVNDRSYDLQIQRAPLAIHRRYAAVRNGDGFGHVVIRLSAVGHLTLPVELLIRDVSINGHDRQYSLSLPAEES